MTAAVEITSTLNEIREKLNEALTKVNSLDHFADLLKEAMAKIESMDELKGRLEEALQEIKENKEVAVENRKQVELLLAVLGQESLTNTDKLQQISNLLNGPATVPQEAMDKLKQVEADVKKKMEDVM